jgi:hypothetical protein
VGFEGAGHGFFNASRVQVVLRNLTVAERFLKGLRYTLKRPAVDVELRTKRNRQALNLAGIEPPCTARLLALRGLPHGTT